MSTQPAVGGVVSYLIKSNVFGDCLPLIPAESFVDFGSVLFRVDIAVLLAFNGIPLKGFSTPFVVSGVHSKARLLMPTDADGAATLRVETRYSGLNTVAPTAPEFKHASFNLTIAEAWYEAPFLITAYNCCDEDEFSGPLVQGKGVGLHKSDFLFGGRGIIMQGTGKACDGRYVQAANPGVLKWNPGYNGVANPDDAIFRYVENPQGAFAPLIENVSIAIDPAILPPHQRVQIVGPRAIGERRGDDTGGAIKGFHFDHFVGSGASAMKTWEAAGGNIAQARVKYLGA